MRVVNVNLIWGFNFLLGTILAALVRWIIKLLKKGKLMHRELTNNYLLDRISGFMFDLMIIAGVAAIDLSQLSGMWWQLLIVCALGTVATFIYLRVACNHLYPGYKEEAFFSMFGMLTGTASNGMILLREIDPKFETPAANNLVLQGSGGTDFTVAVNAFTGDAENQIIFTDGYAEMPEQSCDAIWVVYGSMPIHPKGGRVIYAKATEEKEKHEIEFLIT